VAGAGPAVVATDQDISTTQGGEPSAISKAIRSRKGEEKVVKARSRSEEGWDVEMGGRVYLIGLPAPSLIFGAGKV
jgi:hypothetical protein